MELESENRIRADLMQKLQVSVTTLAWPLTSISIFLFLISYITINFDQSQVRVMRYDYFPNIVYVARLIKREVFNVKVFLVILIGRRNYVVEFK